jgi:CubicO group peptidase (beta-lactamase class C family)
VIAVIAAVGGAQSASAATPSGKTIARTVRVLKERYGLRSVLYGVWVNGGRLASGALGESRPGVAATRADHFRIGNTTESFTTTLLLQLVDQGRVRLDDPVSNWFPSLPGADQVTLGMLAASISGYPDYVTTRPVPEGVSRGPVAELEGLRAAQARLHPPGAVRARDELGVL